SVEQDQHREHEQHAGDQRYGEVEQQFALPLLVAEVHLLDALRQVLERRQLVDFGPYVAFDDPRSEVSTDRQTTKLVRALDRRRPRAEADLGNRLQRNRGAARGRYR